MIKPTSRFALVLGLLVLLLFTPTARGDNRSEAREMHKRGLANYESGNYQQAIEDYQAAYALFAAPGILFNLGHAYRLDGQCAKAKRAYQNFLSKAGDSDQAAVAQRHLDDMGPCPEPKPKDPTPPEGEGLGTGPLTPTSEPSPPEPVTPITHASASGDGEFRLYGLVVGGVGLALLAGGIGYGIDARSKSQEVEDFIAEGGQWNSSLRATEASGQRSETIAIGVSVVGIATLLGGATLYWSGMESPPASRISVSTSTQAKVLTWSGAF